MFQSSPSFYAGCNSNDKLVTVFCVWVSILTQLLCWVQRKIETRNRHIEIEFQSSPSFYAGCNFVCIGGGRDTESFNPHPAFMLGATMFIFKRTLESFCFNPHPAFMLGATKGAGPQCQGRQCFNPHPAFMLGATKPSTNFLAKRRVSILTQLLCWVQRL